MEREPEWQDLLAHLGADDAWGTALVVGPTDVGKTTFCRALETELGTDGAETAGTPSTPPAAFVDGDCGQSILGPPATVGLAWSLSTEAEIIALRCVGSTSPSGHFIQALTGITRLTTHAHDKGAQRVIIDACGYMASEIGREFHHAIIELGRPDHLIALQQGGEMEPLLASFDPRVIPNVHRLPAATGAVARTRAQRQRYRRERLADYFARASLRTLSLRGVGLHGTAPAATRADRWHGRYVAPHDRHGLALVLGIAGELDEDACTLQLWSPPFDSAQVASVQIGEVAEEFPFATS